MGVLSHHMVSLDCNEIDLIMMRVRTLHKALGIWKIIYVSLPWRTVPLQGVSYVSQQYNCFSSSKNQGPAGSMAGSDLRLPTQFFGSAPAWPPRRQPPSTGTCRSREGGALTMGGARPRLPRISWGGKLVPPAPLFMFPSARLFREPCVTQNPLVST